MEVDPFNLRRPRKSAGVSTRAKSAEGLFEIFSPGSSDGEGWTKMPRLDPLPPPPPVAIKPTLGSVVRAASAALRPEQVKPYTVPAFRFGLASTSSAAPASSENARSPEGQLPDYSFVKLPVVCCDVSDITAAVALEAVTDLNSYLVKEFSGGQAQELHGLCSRVTNMLMRLLMSNIELSGSRKRSPDGTITVSKEASSRSRSQVKQQQPADISRSKSRSKAARSKSRPRPPTFSAVIQGRTPLPTTQIRQMVMEGSTTARVKSVRDRKEGGLLVETCSVQELESIIESAKRQDGLVAEVHIPKVPHRVVLMDVSPAIHMEDLMKKMHDKNAKDLMSYEEFCASSKVVSAPTEIRKSLVLEVAENVKDRWLKQKRVFVDWSSYNVRPFVETTVTSCYKCYGTDHQQANCKELSHLCRRCGAGGHLAASCKKAESCRNCRLKGEPHNHSVTSITCPIYGSAQKRRNNTNGNVAE